jgi:hypothetical protein
MKHFDHQQERLHLPEERGGSQSAQNIYKLPTLVAEGSKEKGLKAEKI